MSFTCLVAGLVTLQNLQNLASLQQSLPQVASLAAGLQNLTSNCAANAPLNLSVGASGKYKSKSVIKSLTTFCVTASSSRPLSNGAPSQETPTNLSNQSQGTSIPPLLATQQPAPMPQLILASGQLVQGIQGAQLLIPTSQGTNDLNKWCV